MNRPDSVRKSHFPSLEKGRFRSGAHIRETVPGEEAAEVERDVLKAVICHPRAEGRNLLFGVVQACDKKVGNLHMNTSGMHRQDVLQDRSQGCATSL